MKSHKRQRSRLYGEPFYLAVEGKGAPSGEEFREKVRALFALAFGVKTRMKKDGKDFRVAELEGLPWIESDKHALEAGSEERRWTLFIRMPEFVTSDDVEKARVEVAESKGIEAINKVKFERIT